MNRIGNIFLAIFAVIWLGGQFVFVVFEFDKAVVLQFGKLVKSDIKPGLHFRIPFVDEVHRFDGRIHGTQRPGVAVFCWLYSLAENHVFTMPPAFTAGKKELYFYPSQRDMLSS